MSLEIIIFVIGVIYGYLKPGKQSKAELFKKSIILGIILGIIFALVLGVISMFLGSFAGSFIMATGTFIGILISVIWLALFFIAGVAIGDFIESRTK
jgi:flagellar biosynthesis protein FlhB